MKVFVTGAAGFIGMHLCIRLINEGFEVVGLDNLNDYYSVELKKKRIAEVKKLCPSFSFYKEDLTNYDSLKRIFRENKFDMVFHMAAQAGVRYSIESPKKYLDSNIQGFLNLLEICKEIDLKHLIYASSSSVYGNSPNSIYTETDITDTPMSIYAVSKKTNELMAYTYASLYNIPCTGLRFFTVYGPWGRPDMALFIFTKAILNKEPIYIHNDGDMIRDFTYIDDVIESIVRLIDKQFNLNYKNIGRKSSNLIPHQILNVGNGKPVLLKEFIEVLEKNLGKNAIKIPKSNQLGEVYSTAANNDKVVKLINYIPKTEIEEGVEKFINWYQKNYNT